VDELRGIAAASRTWREATRSTWAGSTSPRWTSCAAPPPSRTRRGHRLDVRRLDGVAVDELRPGATSRTGREAGSTPRSTPRRRGAARATVERGQRLDVITVDELRRAAVARLEAR
jgi:hypothetical protein